uniref:ATP synthase subunit a n=1 Tax=Thelenota ananas TaxID=306322 RepID=A0A8A3T8U9_9ECHN|nr:ATP synthase F0 subunit 6 [Thelenota ananas]QTA29881.1 ATP synthase F0 subunit 6 [Thelenota ananas]
MNLVNSLFGQFSPDVFLLLPLQIISCLLALSWFTLIFPTNFFSGRINYIWNVIRLESIKILFQNVKKEALPWISTLTVVFFIILSINLMGLFPYAFSITSHASFTYSLAIPLWLSVNVLGFYIAFSSRLSHLVPQGTPPFLIPIMIIIETLSLIAQPIALGLRLAANLTAGHLLIFLLSTATWLLISNPVISSITLIILTLLFLLEIGVACIQAYVFTSLVNFYLDQNL